MPDDLTAPAVREPIAFTCDAQTADKLARSVTVASLLTPAVWPLLAIVAGAGIAAGIAEHTWVAGVVTALLLAVALGLLVHVSNRKVLRRVVGPGTVLTSGYDDHPRLVISTNAGATGLDAGSVRRVTRRGEVAILTLSRRTMRLVTPSSLVTASDAAFLDGSGPAPRRAGMTPNGPGEMPYALVVTAEDQRHVQRTLNRAWLRSKALWLVAGVELLVVVMGIAVHSKATMALGLIMLVIVPLNLLLVRRTVRQVFPVGREIRAGLAPDALLLDVSVSTERIPYERIADVAVDVHTVLLTLPMKRRIALPRALLPDEAVAQLTAAVARAGT